MGNAVPQRLHVHNGMIRGSSEAEAGLEAVVPGKAEHNGAFIVFGQECRHREAKRRRLCWRAVACGCTRLDEEASVPALIAVAQIEADALDGGEAESKTGHGPLWTEALDPHAEPHHRAVLDQQYCSA